VNPAGNWREPAPANQHSLILCCARPPERRQSISDVIIRETPDGGIVRVKSVARVELGADDYSIVSRLNGRPAQ